MIHRASENQVKDHNLGNNPFEKILRDTFSDGNSSCCTSPETPTSVLPEFNRERFYRPPLLLSLRVEAVRKLNPINDVNNLGFHFSHVGPFDASALETEQKTEEMKRMANGEMKDLGEFQNPNSNDKILQEKMMLMTPQTPQTAHDHNQHQEKHSKVMLLTEVEPEKLVQPPRPLPQIRPKSQTLQNSPLVWSAPPMSPPPPQSSGGEAKAAPLPLPLPPPPPPPSPMPLGNGGALPPPPPVCGAVRSLCPKKTNTKLKRSTQLGNLYRTLKGKVEGTVQDGKSSAGRKGSLRNSSNAGGKQGMADALAEMAKRSSYFQQIEEDVQKYTKHIMEIKPAISSFQTKDMDEILKFHKDVEAVLDHLTDESQVFSRFEGFPIKKLEALRTAVALHKKLDNILKELQNWKFETPISQLLDKVERYFNKIKVEVDAIERTKDEELKKLRSNNIDFDFIVLIRIKESMVDVSSSCMEIALKDKREANQAEDKIEKKCKKETKKRESGKMLWRAFQLAFRVYTFAGGHDDRADNLTRELAQEIESDSSS